MPEQRPPDQRLIFRPGTVIGGKYRIDRTLAEGGMGTVVAAYHLALEQPVALKFVRAEEGSDFKALLELFKREAKAAARLKSEHVARVLDVAVTEDGLPFMVMEYLEGQSMDQVLKEGGPLEISSAVGYAIQACECLAEAHAHGIVHRDVKPPNLFLVDRAPGLRSLKVLDFGISKFTLSEVGSHATNVMVGTLCYMSPEQIRSSGSVDHRTDLWSLGATLYEMLSGKAPFDATADLQELVEAIWFKPPAPLRELRPEVPEQLAAVISRCLSKNAGARFGSAGELAMALLPFAAPAARPLAEQAASLRPLVKASRPAAPSGPILREPTPSTSRPVVVGKPEEARRPLVPRSLVTAVLFAAVICVVTFTAAELIITGRHPHESSAGPKVPAEVAVGAPRRAPSEPHPVPVGVQQTGSAIALGLQQGSRAAEFREGRFGRDDSQSDRSSGEGVASRRSAWRSSGGSRQSTSERTMAKLVAKPPRGSARGLSQKVEVLSDLPAIMPPAAVMPSRRQDRFPEVDPSGGHQPLRPIDVRNPYFGL